MFCSAYKYPESNIQFVSDYIVKGIFFLQLKSNKKKVSLQWMSDWRKVKSNVEEMTARLYIHEIKSWLNK